MLSLDVTLKLSGYDISIRKWCIRNQCKERYIAISAREDTLQSEFAEHPVILNFYISTTV
jgi:hypothetical protein